MPFTDGTQLCTPTSVQLACYTFELALLCTLPVWVIVTAQCEVILKSAQGTVHKGTGKGNFHPLGRGGGGWVVGGAPEGGPQHPLCIPIR